MSTLSTTFILPDLLAIFEHAAADDLTSSLNPNFVEAEQPFEAWYRGKAVELPAEVYKIWAEAQIPIIVLVRASTTLDI
ncbi:hypothetical protein B0H14DRAFT_3443392 [Mycena olivaceomarginata]|nr:hypothetical protein B0H14DRAFT_3443392 [Mycena olivaceomarginata]